MSIITKQPSEFHNHIPNQSSTTNKDLPVQQQQLVQDNSNQKHSEESSVSNTHCPRTSDDDFSESLLTDKDVCGNNAAEKIVSEDYAESVTSKRDANLHENVLCERTLKDERIFHTDNKVESSLNIKPKEILLTDKSLFKCDSEEQKSFDKAPKVTTTFTKQAYSTPNISQDLNTISWWNYPHSKCYIKQEVVPVANLSEANSLQFDKQLDDVDKKDDNIGDVKEGTEQLNDPADNVDTKSDEDSLSGALNTQDDGNGRKNSLDVLHREELNKNESFRNEVSGTKHSDFTSLISSQRETILKLRREERLSEERTVESKSKQENRIKNIRAFEPSEIRKPNMSTDSISSTRSEKNKQKKLKKKRVDYCGINDLFSEPLNVKQFYSDRKKKREKKIPSKFLYLSKMEKYLSHSPKVKHKYKTKHNHSNELTTKIKLDKKENIKECVKAEPGVKEVNKIKIFSMKDEDAGVLRKHIKVDGTEQSQIRLSGSRSSSKSSTSPFKNSLLRDVHFHQHCRRRYYRLKQSNWNCSSRRALHLLKRKYNSIKLLFDREPIICLERLNVKDPCVQSVTETSSDGTDIKSESMKKFSPWTGKVKSEMEESKVKKSLTQEHGFIAGSETENLVDPRVMSLSKTLQSTNSGKVGVEKIFKNYSSKPFKSKKKESESKSHSNSVKKRAKPDWSKWKEKLKEASNRMVERKKSGLVIEKTINTFPNSYIKNSPPSILHFRIPLKSSNKVKTEDNKALNKEIKSDAIDNVACDSSSKDILQRDALKLDMKTAKVSENEDQKDVLKEIDEELTLEEFETDKAITYSINGYSIEISRDSPIDIRMNDKKTSVKSECFDEDEVNKILYGDNLDDVSLDCHDRNIQEHFNDTDAGLTVTSDIIPNLCAQDEFFQTNSDNFSGDMDKSPPVLERSEYKTENSDDESKNTYIVQINDERQESGNPEEMIEKDAEYCDNENETFNSDNVDDMKREKLMTVNQDEIEIKMESEIEVSYDERVDTSPSTTTSSDALSDDNFIIQEDNQPVSDNDGEDGMCDSPSFVIENVCSLSEATHGGVEFLHKKDGMDRKESDYERAGDTAETCENSSSTSVKLLTNEAEKHESVDKLTLPMTQNGRNEALEKVDLCSGLKEDSLDIKHSDTNVKFKESMNGSMSKDTKTSLQSQSKKENILNVNTCSGERKSNELQADENSETVLCSKINYGNRGSDKAPEKSAAAVMEDLEKMWREMTSKPEIENVSIKETTKVDKGDLTEGFKNINEKVCNIANSIVFRKCASKEWTEAIKKVSDTHEDPSKDKKGSRDTFIDNNSEKQIDSDFNLETKELDSKTQIVSAKPDLCIKVTNSHETNESEIRSMRKTSTPISSIDYDMDNSDNRGGNMSVVDLVENHDELAEESELEYGTEETEVTSSTGDKDEEAVTKEDETSQTEQMKTRKRKNSSDNQTSLENPHSQSEDNMEQADERIMRDFPNHNWLFNKYNISENRPEKETVKETKVKKQKKEDKDVAKHSAKHSGDVKCRRKSSHSTANILPTQRKQSSSKNDNLPESQNLQKEGIKIKWNKVSKRNSLCDSVNLDEKNESFNQKGDDINVIKTKSFGQFNDTLSNNSLSNKNTFSPICSESNNSPADTTVSHRIKENNTNIEMDQSSNSIKSLNGKDVQDSYTHYVQHYKHSSDIVLEDKMNDNASALSGVDDVVKTSESLERKLFGELSDEDDDDEKLQIDETVCTEDAPEAQNLSLHVDQAVLDDNINKAIKSDDDELNVTEVTSISINKTSDLTLVAADSSTFTNLDIKPDVIPTTDLPSTVSEIIPTEVVSLKNTGLHDSNKPECGGISFKPRAKPPVQLVHPQIHKPPVGKVKTETVLAHELPTHVSIHTEESVTVSLTAEVNGDQADSGVHSGHVSKSDQIRTALNPSVTFASNIQLSSPSLPVTVLSTLAQQSSGSITVTTTSTSSFGNGMVVPIQPFMQNIPNSLPPGFVQNMPQLQSNIVQIQSPSIKQNSPVHIQNQLIPITIYQAGSQTLISNYTYTNTGSEHIASNQSANIIQAQPLSFNMNQTQINTTPVQIPICRPVNSGPPPLLILPKHSNLSTFNQQTNQAFQTKKENCSFKKRRMSPKCQNNNIKDKEKPEDKDIKQEGNQVSFCEEQFNNGMDLKQDFTSDSGKEGSHAGKENSEEELDDEIKKQMEELDKEIKRKEQEQEEMRRKKIELLEKMKQAKNNSKLKEMEVKVKSEDKWEKENTVTDQCDKTEDDESFDSELEVEKKDVQETVPDVLDQEIEKDIDVPCKDVVLSEINEEADDDDDVFDSDTPIDLSSALKSNKINSFSSENLSVTVSDGIISIKETDNIENSLSSVSVQETKNNEETTDEKSESEFDCVDDEDGTATESYAENKCDGINYIEDIGLVNPFTGEYEINEDVEGVEYLDLSTTKTDDTSDSKESEKFDEIESEESIVTKELSKSNDSDSNIENLTKVEEEPEKVNEKHAPDISSEESASTNTPVSSCTALTITNVSETIDQPSSNSIQSPMTAKSVVSSCDTNNVTTVTSSVVENLSGLSACTVSSTMNSFPSSISSSISVSSKDSIVDNVSDIGESPLNLEKVKLSSSEKRPTLFHNDVTAQSLSASDKNVNAENTPEPEKSEAIQENNAEKLTRSMNTKNVKDDIPHGRDAQMTNTSDAANTLPQKQISLSTNGPPRSFSIRKLMQRHDQHVLAQGNNLEHVRQNVHRHVLGMNMDIRRRGREKYMEVKPAHYRSPPRKIQRGEKPLPAHNQRPTSRETMKRMCKTAFIPPLVIHRTSPFLRKKHPNFLSPKEILKPFPRLWEKKLPKPAHSKRPFGIAGHLIVQSSRKYRKRDASEDWTPSPRFYSLPNTPTSTGSTPPRATSVEFQRSSSPLHSPSDAQVSAPSSSSMSSTVSSTSTLKTLDHHGAQVGLPTPIRAHCRPKSLMSSNQFYETSVLRPPALLRNSKPESEVHEPDVVEVIDLTADLPPTTKSDLARRQVESPKSKERTIQKELNHAVSKRQRLDSAEAPNTEKVNYPGRQVAARLQQQLGQINARQRLMPPPPYTGRQRMPVLVQVPRQPVFEQIPRMQKIRRMDPQFDEKRKLFAQNTDMPRFQTPPEMIQVGPQNRPQGWPAHYAVPNHESRQYGATRTQEMSPGSEHMVQNQDVHKFQTAQRPIYPAVNPAQASDGANIGFAGNPRMQHPANGNLNSIPQQGFPIRGQNMPYAATQHQTQIHQLLQQPHASSQMMQRGNISPQVMQRERIEASPHFMQRGDISPQAMQRGDISPQAMQRGDISPQAMQRGDISPQAIQRGDISPQAMQRGNISPQAMQRGDICPQAMQRGNISPQIIQRNEISPQSLQRGEISPQYMPRGDISPQIMQRGITSPQINNSVSPHMLQRGMGNQMTQNSNSSLHMMQTPNNQMNPTGEFNQKVMYAPGSGPQMVHGTNPQGISVTGIPLQTHSSVNSFQRSPITSDNQVHGQSTVQPILTPEERIQKMKQIRAQHIRAQQMQNRAAQGVGFEHGTRMPDVRSQQVAIEQNSSVGPQQMAGPQQMIGAQQMAGPQQMIGPQQMAGPQQIMPQQMNAFNMGVQPQSVRQKGPHVPPNSYPQQMAVLEPQMQQGFSPHQNQQKVDPGSKVPNSYMMSGPSGPQQTNFQQNGMLNENTLPKNNLAQRTSVYTSNQNVQVIQSKTTPTVMNLNQQSQNQQGQDHAMSSNAAYLTQGQQVQGHIESRSKIPGNMTCLPGGQFVQGHTDRRMRTAFQKNMTGQGQFQNSNWRGQNIDINKDGQMTMPKQQLYPVSGANSDNQTVTVMPHSQHPVAMTTSQVISHSAIPLNLAVNQINQSAGSNTQALGSQGQREGQDESKVVEELPHLQQVHGECVMCGKYSLYLCSNCKKIWYCSPECQLTHWQTHADECEGQTG